MQHRLKIHAFSGFSHQIPNSIFLHPTNKGIIFPFHNSIQHYDGQDHHELKIFPQPLSFFTVCEDHICVSRKGFEGQLSTTEIFNWKFPEKQKKYRLTQHQIKFLAISCDGRYICKMNQINPSQQQVLIIDTHSQISSCIIWKLKLNMKVLKVNHVAFCNKHPNILLVLFNHKILHLTIIQNEVLEQRIFITKSRIFMMATFSKDDRMSYICTKNGDIFEIDMLKLKEKQFGPRKRVIIGGISHIRVHGENHLLIVGQNGFLALLEIQQLRIIKQLTIKQEINSITECRNGICYIATQDPNIFELNVDQLQVKIFYSSHNGRVNGFKNVFASCGGSEVILWRLAIMRPLFRIKFPKIECFCINFLKNHQNIASGWDDFCIRIICPSTGKLVHRINNSHIDKVYTLQSDSIRMLSGGNNGDIRVWELKKKNIYKIQGALIFHKKKVTSIVINKNNSNEALSTSQDGYYVVWDLQLFELRYKYKMKNYLTQIQMIDEYNVCVVGLGQNLISCAKFDGQIKSQLQVGGSIINCFEPYKINKRLYYLFGNDEKKLTCIFTENGEKISHATYGTVNSIKISLNNEYILVGTSQGGIFCFKLFSKYVQISKQSKMNQFLIK